MNKFIDGYAEEVIDCLKAIDHACVAKIADTLRLAYDEGRQIFIIGNGGSASTASHMACDLSKGILGHKGDKTIKRFRVSSLADNVAAITAWANDTSYDSIFAEQLKNLAQEGDVIIAISASGNSANVIAAIEAAKERGLSVIGLAGFGGGKVLEKADLCLVIASQRYDVTEDLHMVISHMITRWFFEKLNEK